MEVTKRLKQNLWSRFGTTTWPAEWDGHIYGGGKLSQRYWEYFQAVELLNLDGESVVLDIGGGSPVTGAGFFASLLATQVRRVIIIDPNVSETMTAPANIEFMRRNASEEELISVFAARPEITHVSCISVFEHIPPASREPMVRAIDSFKGKSFVTTFEYHALHTFFEHQLTTKTTSSLFSSLTRFYPDEFRSSPVLCENAYDTARVPKLSHRAPFAPADIPRWYPVAIRFVPVGETSEPTSHV